MLRIVSALTQTQHSDQKAVTHTRLHYHLTNAHVYNAASLMYTEVSTWNSVLYTLLSSAAKRLDND